MFDPANKTVAAFAAFALFAIGAFVMPRQGHAETIEIYAAGSLRAAIQPSLLKDAGLAPDVTLKTTFGPAGALRERIEKGEHADLFLSADMKGPQALAAGGRTVMPAIAFARNRMCLIGPANSGLTPDTLVERMLAPDVKLATSTPIVDPGGDYALALFERAEALHPGATKALTAKALRLLGAPGQAAPMPGVSATASLFLRKQADMLIYYCSGSASLIKEAPSLTSVPFPDSLDPKPIYGMAVLTNNPAALQLALFLVSEGGQKRLIEAGFQP